MSNGESETVENTSCRVQKVLFYRNFLFLILFLLLRRSIVCSSAWWQLALPNIWDSLISLSYIVQIQLRHVDIISMIHVNWGVQIQLTLVGARRHFHLFKSFVILHVRLNLALVLELQALLLGRRRLKVVSLSRSHLIIIYRINDSFLY